LPFRQRSGGAPRDARLIVTVVDESHAPSFPATVALVGVDEATKKATFDPLKTSDKGIATFEHLVPGRYSIKAEFPGFQLGLLRDVRLRAATTSTCSSLPIEEVRHRDHRGRDPQAAASAAGRRSARR
jgi:hypothetical protein